MIILASTSPRRKELLQSLDLKFKVISPTFDEEIQDKSLKPTRYVKKLAQGKVNSVKDKYPNNFIISADTIVVYKNEIFEKPKNKEDAYRMLTTLKGKTHLVITAISIEYNNKNTTYLVKSKVKMRNYSNFEIDEYIETKEPFDKAGSYAIQGIGSKLVEYYKNDLNNIIGLPLKKLTKILRKNRLINI